MTASRGVVGRPWRLDDAAELSSIAASFPDLERQWPVPLSQVVDEPLDVVRDHLVPGEGRRHWALESDGRIVGDVGLTGIDRQHGIAWVSYWLVPDRRGRGLATAAMAAATSWGFAQGLFRLEQAHRVDNPASCAVATRCGYRIEGLKRSRLEYGGVRFDVEMHAILATDPRPVGDEIVLVDD